MSHPFSLFEREDDVSVEEFVAFVTSEPGTFGGVGLGMSVDDLAGLGIPIDQIKDDELYLGDEEIEEQPETPYHEEDPEWDKDVAREIVVTFEDGVVTALHCILRGYTPTEDCFHPEPPHGNQKLPAIRDQIIAELSAQFDHRVGKKRVRFLDGDLLIECNPMVQETIYEPWDQFSFEIELKENPYTEEELTLRPFTGTDEELEIIRNAIDTPDSFDAYRPITRVEYEKDEDGGFIFSSYYIDEDEEEGYAVLRWDAPDEILSPTYGANQDFTLAFIHELAKEFSDDDLYGDDDEW